MVGIRDVSKYSLDHFVLWARPMQRPAQCHKIYLQGRCDLPLTLPMLEHFSLSDSNLQYLEALEHPP